MLPQLKQYFENLRALLYYLEIVTHKDFCEICDRDRYGINFQSLIDGDYIFNKIETAVNENTILENEKLKYILDLEFRIVDIEFERLDLGMHILHRLDTNLSFMSSEIFGLSKFLRAEIEYEKFTAVMFHDLVAELVYKDNERIEALFKSKNLNNEGDKNSVTPKILTKHVLKQKLKWSGTPGEFGAIFNELFDQGYIERVNDLTKIVRALNEIFDIRNEKSAPVDNKYLYKCFKEKERSYFPEKLNIPKSDNYYKKK